MRLSSPLRMITLLCFLSLTLGACDSAVQTPVPVSIQTDFSEGASGWSALFTNYPVDQESFYELEAEVRPLPPSMAQEGSGFFLYGFNHSDDLNMHLMRRVAGLVPDVTYRVGFHLTIATNAPSGCVGVGGPPGEAVTVHAAASKVKPALGTDRYSLNLTEGYVEEGAFDSWYRAFGLGDIANGIDCEQAGPDPPYLLKTLASGPGHASVEADASGRAWLLVGTRSGFEAQTGLYYTRISIDLRPE